MNEQYMLREIFDALPSIIFVVDQDVRIQEYNAAAKALITSTRSTIIQRRAGEVIKCIHAQQTAKGCGGSPQCTDCLIRDSVKQALQGKRVVRQRTRMQIIQKGQQTEIFALITVSPFSFHNAPRALLVIEDISEIAELYKKMIFICPVCGKMQGDKKAWMRVESYFKNNWNVDCSHGYCPDCFQKEMKKIRFSAQGGEDLPIID